MNKRPALRRLFSAALIGSLSACAVGPDYHRPSTALPAAFPGAATTGQGAVIPQWWTLYGDATLDNLVAAALTSNVDIRKAVARIDEAQATLDEVDTSFFPGVDLNAARTRSHSSVLNAVPLPPGAPVVSTSNHLGLSTAFEIDLWGRLRRASETARAELLSSQYARDVTALALAGATAQAYFNLRSAEAQTLVAKDTLASRNAALDVARSRAKAGLASDLDVAQAQSSQADAAIQLRDFERQRSLFEHLLATLTGNLDLHIVPGQLMTLPVPAAPPPGLPSTLLERRPDVQAAEQALVAANAQIGFYRAAQLPTLSLTGAFGGQSAELGDLLKRGARVWSYGPSITMPIFDAGRTAARTRQAAARARQAEADYDKAVQTAFKEVADALTNVQASAAVVGDVQRKRDAAREALRLARLRYDSGYSAYIDVLDAQRTANAGEQALVQNRQAQLAYSVDLMKALGGGWTKPDSSAQRHGTQN